MLINFFSNVIIILTHFSQNSLLENGSKDKKKIDSVLEQQQISPVKELEYLKNFKSLYSFPKYFSFPFFQPKNSLNFIFIFKFERIKKLSLDKNARNLFKNNNNKND